MKITDEVIKDMVRSYARLKPETAVSDNQFMRMREVYAIAKKHIDGYVWSGAAEILSEPEIDHIAEDCKKVEKRSLENIARSYSDYYRATNAQDMQFLIQVLSEYFAQEDK